MFSIKYINVVDSDVCLWQGPPGRPGRPGQAGTNGPPVSTLFNNGLPVLFVWGSISCTKLLCTENNAVQNLNPHI